MAVPTQTDRHVALFDKCRNFTKAREVQAMGLYPYFTPIQESEDTVVKIDGKSKVKDVVAAAAKDIGAPVKVAGFVRMALGEGVEATAEG